MRNKELRSVERRIYDLAQSGKLSQDESTGLMTELKHLKHAISIKDQSLVIKSISTIVEVVMRAK